MLTTPTIAQTWEPITEPALWAPPALVYDDANGRVVQFGSTTGLGSQIDDTWEWDGARWQLRRPANQPPAGGAMAYDRARRVVVLFDQTRDTWEWRGADWTRVAAGSPRTVTDAAIAWDPQHQRVILFGTAGSVSETWHWDGVQWTPLSPANSPPPRANFALSGNPKRGTVVLFGGNDGACRRDTWEWDGTNWLRRLPLILPPLLKSPRMAYDSARSRTVMVGRGKQRSPTWVWDEGRWTRISMAQELPTDRYDLAFDSERGVMVARGSLDTWTWDTRSGTDWNQHPRPQPPLSWLLQEMVFDSVRDRAVLVTGETSFPLQTWEWDPSLGQWSDRTPAVNPPARDDTALAFDSRRGRTVMFGGNTSNPSGNIWLNDTWEWDGTSWQQRNPANSPPPRTLHAMAFDPIRGVTVLFSGYGNSTLADTWEWDGTDWTDVTPAVSPPAQGRHAMAFDPVTSAVMMLGVPPNPFSPAPDVWDWDGTSWTVRTPAPGPFPQAIAGLMPDPAGRILLLSTDWVVFTIVNRLWEWNGAAGTWTQQSLNTNAPAADIAVFDPSRGVLAAGLSGTWTWGEPRALATPFGKGCAGIAGRPALAATGRPRLGNASFGIDVVPVQPGWTAFFVLSATAEVHELPGGCRWYLGPAFAAIPVATTAAGDATLPLPIPNAVALIGVDPVFQVLVGDPAGQLLGTIAASDAMRVRFGL